MSNNTCTNCGHPRLQHSISEYNRPCIARMCDCPAFTQAGEAEEPKKVWVTEESHREALAKLEPAPQPEPRQKWSKAHVKKIKRLAKSIDSAPPKQPQAVTDGESEFRKRFRELKKQRNNHLIDEPDFDEAVEQLAADTYAHPTEPGYCCACNADKAFLNQQLEAKTAARVADTLEQAKDFGLWLTGKCDLHEKYTSACCGCQRASSKLSLLEDYHAYIDTLNPTNKETK
jgi:hypothetical protein